jgi:hypothetical protein
MSSMCNVCDHPSRVEIEHDLSVYRTSGRGLIAARYGVTQAALELHWRHLPEALADTREAVMARVQRTERMCEDLYELATQPIDGRINIAGVATALRELRGAQALLISMLPPPPRDSSSGALDLEVILRAEIRGNPTLARMALSALPPTELRQLVESREVELDETPRT